MITAQEISSAILTVAPGNDLNGIAMPVLARTVGQAVSQWLPIGVTVKGNTAGTAGIGNVTGFVQVPQHPSPAVTFALFGFDTFSGAKLANALSQGLAIALMKTPYTGVSSSVGIGTDFCTVSSTDLNSLIELLNNFLPANFESQVQTDTQNKLAIAMGNLIQQQISLGYGQGAITGPSSTVGATGTSESKFI